MYGFNFSTAALAEAQPVNKLIMYYTVGDTTRMEYQYLINTATVNKYVHNRTGSDADFFIKNPSRGDSLAFMQAMGGVKTVVSFKDLSSLSDKLINKVELDVFVFEPTNQQGTFSNPSQLIASRKNASGNIELIQDLAQLINSGVSFATVFKGQLNEEGTVRKYTMNITNHIKNAVKDKTYNSDLYIGILNEQESPRRVIFYGPKHKSNPMKLRVNYTKVQ